MRQHDLSVAVTSSTTQCFVCNERIESGMLRGVLDRTPAVVREEVTRGLGPVRSGVSCKTCGVNVHQACTERLTSPCAEVYHKFEQRSFAPFSKSCAACGTTLQGLFNQGFVCVLCGIVVHPGCRTNALVKFCLAAPDSLEDEEENAAVVTPGGMSALNQSEKQQKIYRFESNSSSDEKTSIAHKAKEWGEKMTRRLSGSRRKSTKPQRKQSTTAAGPIPIPSTLIDMGREIRKLHIMNRAVALGSAMEWEREELPRLRASRIDLTKLKTQLKDERDALVKTSEKLARKRTAHYRRFVIKLLQRYSKLKKNTAEEIADDLIDRFSKFRCRESELCDALLDLVPEEAHPFIEAERDTGPCQKDGKLEKLLASLEERNEEVKVAIESLEAVRRELFFPRWRNWFARMGFEGRYVAIGETWLEELQGSIAIQAKCVDGKHGLVPSITLSLTGRDAEVNFDADSLKKRRRHDSGARILNRFEQLSLSGSGVPYFFSFEQLTLDLEFNLFATMEYFESRKSGIKGAWRLKPSKFSMRFKKFEFSFTSANRLNIPDGILRTVVKNIIVSGVKQTLTSMLPTELGEYMMYLHLNVPANVKPPHDDQFRFHGVLDMTAQVDLATLDYAMESSATNNTLERHDTALSRVAKGAARSATWLASVAMGSRAPEVDTEPSSRVPGHVFKDVPLLIRAQQALGLDQQQMDLFMRTQQQLGLTRDSLFPDDSLSELGVRAIVSNVQDLQASVDAANKLGLRALAGDLLNSEPPLRTLQDVVKYVNTYFGPDAQSSVHTEKIIAIWQGALDRMLHKLQASTSFRGRFESTMASGQQIPVRRISFTDLITRALAVSRKRVLTQAKVVSIDVHFAAEHLFCVLRDRLLDTAAKSHNGSAMVFQLRHTRGRQNNKTGKTFSRDEMELDIEDVGHDDADADASSDPNSLEDDADDAEVDGEGETFKGLEYMATLNETFSGEIDEDDEDEVDLVALNSNAILLPSTSIAKESRAFGERRRQREEKILQRHDKTVARLNYLRASLVETVSFVANTRVGQGSYAMEFKDIDLVAPVDFRYNFNGAVFGNRARQNNWPWRRITRAESDGRMHVAVVKVLNPGALPGAEIYSDPDADESFHIEFSSIDSKVVLADNSQGAMRITVEPKAASSEDRAQGGWSAPGSVTFHWKSEEAKFMGKMDFFELYGGLEHLKEYTSDLLAVSLQNNNANPKREVFAQDILQLVIQYAQMNSFVGSAKAAICAETIDDDIFVRVAAPHGTSKEGEEIGFNLQLESNLMDTLDDIARLLSDIEM